MCYFTLLLDGVVTPPSVSVFFNAIPYSPPPPPPSPPRPPSPPPRPPPPLPGIAPKLTFEIVFEGLDPNTVNNTFLQRYCRTHPNVQLAPNKK